MNQETRHRISNQPNVLFRRRRAAVPRGRRLKQQGWFNQGIYRFKRTVLSTATISTNGTTITETHGVFYFKLNDIASYAEFSNLFDQYRIRRIVMYWMPRRTEVTGADANSAGLQVMPNILTVQDYDDGTAEDYTALVQYPNCKVHQGIKPFRITVRPKIAMAAYGGAFTRYASVGNKMWLDMASNDIEYYGIKWATMPYPQALNKDMYWDIKVDYYCEFKNPR